MGRSLRLQPVFAHAAQPRRYCFRGSSSEEKRSAGQRRAFQRLKTQWVASISSAAHDRGMAALHGDDRAVSGAEDLADVGATAVNVATIEQKIIEDAQKHAAGGAEAPQPDADTLQDQLRAVRREARAVRSAAGRLHPRAPEGAEPDEGASLVGGELQQAVMRQRLAGLEAEEATLRAALAAVGQEPEDDAPTEAALQEVLMEEQRKKSKGRKKGQQVQFDLEEADLFDAADAAAAAAQGRGGASLVETERDRLIRLVCFALLMLEHCIMFYYSAKLQEADSLTVPLPSLPHLHTGRTHTIRSAGRFRATGGARCCGRALRGRRRRGDCAGRGASARPARLPPHHHAPGSLPAAPPPAPGAAGG